MMPNHFSFEAVELLELLWLQLAIAINVVQTHWDLLEKRQLMNSRSFADLKKISLHGYSVHDPLDDLFMHEWAQLRFNRLIWVLAIAPTLLHALESSEFIMPHWYAFILPFNVWPYRRASDDFEAPLFSTGECKHKSSARLFVEAQGNDETTWISPHERIRIRVQLSLIATTTF